MRKLIFILTFCTLGGGSWAQCSNSVLEAFGATASLALYNTYITIGSIADGYVGETYDAARTIELMEEQLTMMKSLQNFITKTLEDSKSGLSSDDKDYLTEMNQCLDQLYNEAQGLKEFADGGGDVASEKYSGARTNAWELISDLLGFDE